MDILRGDNPNALRRGRVTTSVMLAGLLLTACETVSPFDGSAPPETTDPMVLSQRVLENTPTCHKLDPESPYMDILRTPPRHVVVDGRCRENPDDPILTFTNPDQTTNEINAFSRYSTGDVVEFICQEFGPEVTNRLFTRDQEKASRTWIYTAQGFISQAYVQGPVDELRECIPND